MVTVTNGQATFRVTSGAVKLYKSMGFREVSDVEAMQMQVDAVQAEAASVPPEEKFDEDDVTDASDVEQDGEDADEAYVSELLEKPLSQWSNEEVKEFVRIRGVDTSGAKKLSQVREIIKNYLEEQNKNVEA